MMVDVVLDDVVGVVGLVSVVGAVGGASTAARRLECNDKNDVGCSGGC